MRPRAKKRYGQHFLQDAWADKLVAAIDPQRDDRFIEIGPGPGALTVRLASRVSDVMAIEVDQAMVEALRAEAARQCHVGSRRLSRRRSRFDYSEAAVTRRRQPSLQRVFADSFPAVGNSPAHGLLVDATLMLQREVADRITAAPGTGEYGVLSISVQMHCDVRRVLALPPGAFRPPPRVHSAVVHFRFRPPSVAVADDRVFEAMVRSMFTQRRKTLQNALRTFRVISHAGRGQRARSGRASTRAADPRRCNLQSWRGLRTISFRQNDELCYSLRVFTHAVRADRSRLVPAFGPVDTGRGALPLHDAFHPPGWLSQRGLSFDRQRSGSSSF